MRSPSFGVAPSATTTIANRAPRASRRAIISATGSSENGISGIRIAWAPAATPALSAIQPGVASHQLDDEHPAVRCRRGEQPVDALGGDLDRGVEPERGVRLVEVVVDRLRHADHRQPGVGQPPPDRQRAVAADRDQGVDPRTPKEPDQLVGAIDRDPRAVLLLHRKGGRVAPVRAAQDRAAEVADAAHHVARQLDHAAGRVQLGEHQPVETVADADDLPTSSRGGQCRGPDDGVETRRVAAPGRDRDLHRI